MLQRTNNLLHKKDYGNMCMAVGSGTIIHRYCTENGGSIYITYLIDSSGTYCVYSITEG